MGCTAIVRASILLFSALSASAAYADGECVQGFRDTTAADRQTMLGVMEGARAGLPLAPAGWVIGGYEELSPVGRICIDGESTPWAYGFSRTFDRVDDQAQRERDLADVRTAARAKPEARQPRMDAVAAVSEEFAAFVAEGEDPALLESVASATMQDRTMSIAVRVNPGGVCDPDMQSVTPFAGARSAYRWTSSHDGIETAHAQLLFGDWAPRPAGGMTSGRGGTVSSAAAHAISVSVDADPGRIDSLLGSIDFAAIAATLAR